MEHNDKPSTQIISNSKCISELNQPHNLYLLKLKMYKRYTLSLRNGGGIPLLDDSTIYYIKYHSVRPNFIYIWLKISESNFLGVALIIKKI